MKRKSAATVSGAIVVASGIGLMVLRYFAGSADAPEGWFAAIGFWAPFVGAGLLAVVGANGHNPALCLGAGIALWPLYVVSVVLVPLLVPATIMIWVGVTNAPRARDLWLAELLGAALVVVFGFLLFHQDPATWTTATGFRSSSNIVTTIEALVSVVTVVLVVGLALLWTRQRRGIERQPDPQPDIA